MRHHQDIMNAESWNPDLKKPKDQKNCADGKITKGGNEGKAKTEKSLSSNISIPRIPDNIIRSEPALPLELESSEKNNKIQELHDQPENNKRLSLKTGEAHVAQAKSSTIEPSVARKRAAKKRNNGRKNKWFYILPGLLISIVSGVLVFTWLARPDNTEIIPVQGDAHKASEIAKDAPQEVLSDYSGSDLFGRKESSAPEDTPADKDNNVDDSNEEVIAGIHMDKELEGSEDMADNLAVARAKDSPFNDPSDVILRFEEKSPAEILKDNKDVNDQHIISDKETPAETIQNDSADVAEQLPVEKSTDISSADEKTVPVEQRSRHPVAERGAAVHEITTISEDVQDGDGTSLVTEKTGVQTSGNNSTALSERFPAEDESGPSASSPDRNLNENEEVDAGEYAAYEGAAEEGYPEVAHSMTDSGSIKENEREMPDSGAGAAEYDMETGRAVSIPQFLKGMIVRYEDQFNDNSNSWPVMNTGTASSIIKNGQYHIEHEASAGIHTVLKPHDFPHDMDFVINVLINSAEGAGENAYGFIFGAKDGENNFSFQIRSDHHYAIKKIDGGNIEKLAEGPIDNIFISRESRKTLRIVKQGTRASFYINDHFIDSIENIDFPGNRIGFLVEGKLKLSIDWIKTQISFKDGTAQIGEKN